MKRLIATLTWDIRRQVRNGFYTVSILVAILLVILLKQIGNVDWGLWWPAIILENLIINAFYFMAGLVLLEKGEGTLEAQVITPLRPGEYLASKALSLVILSLAETLLVVAVVTGFAFDWLMLMIGIAFLVTLYVLYGFFVVARYDSITEFILPSALWTMGFSLPLLDYFDLAPSGWMFLHPLQAPLVLMQAAFESLPAWQIAYGFLYSLLWIGIGAKVGLDAFHRFVIIKAGVRRRMKR